MPSLRLVKSIQWRQTKHKIYLHYFPLHVVLRFVDFCLYHYIHYSKMRQLHWRGGFLSSQNSQFVNFLEMVQNLYPQISSPKQEVLPAPPSQSFKIKMLHRRVYARAVIHTKLKFNPCTTWSRQGSSWSSLCCNPVFFSALFLRHKGMMVLKDFCSFRQNNFLNYFLSDLCCCLKILQHHDICSSCCA